MRFIERNGLYTDEQKVAAKEVLDRAVREDLDVVRVVFADQHGLLRGKTVAVRELASALRDGVTIVSTLLSKDTSGTTVYSAFAADGGVGMAEMAGAGDMVMIPDPTTFRVLDWADRTGWILSDLRFTNGAQVPLCSRTLLKGALDRAALLGFVLKTGVELEFHLLHEAVDDLPVRAVNAGYQLLSEDRMDAIGPIQEILVRSLLRLGVPLRTLELEFGPSQLELTLSPELGVDAADTVVLVRSAVKQIARRHGFHATFMCRPLLPNVFSSGWHLHSSLTRPGGGEPSNAFLPDQESELLSTVGGQFLAGQLRHARAASVFAVPTINGYKRFRAYTMAPDRVLWGKDNRAAMLRVTGSVADGSVHIENRMGEPAANPYLYMASQLLAGLNGIENQWPLQAAVDEPYETEAPRLPATLDEALRSLAADTHFVETIGTDFVNYFTGIKRHEISRFNSAVTDWEQAEYFTLF